MKVRASPAALQRAYREGAQARTAGVPFHDKPYGFGAPERDAWNRGYRDEVQRERAHTQRTP